MSKYFEGELTDQQIMHVRAIEHFLVSEPGQFWLTALAMSREEIVKKAVKYNAEIHWRKQQGYILGFDECMDTTQKLITAAREQREIQREQQEELTNV